MKYIVVLLIIVSVLVLSTETKSAKKEWKYFKTEFNKSYESNTEEQKRFKIFKQHFQNINKHNQKFKKGEVTYLQEINRFADLTEGEFAEYYGVVDNEAKIKFTNDLAINKTESNGTYDDLDWREKGGFTPVKDQGHCGSCWIFSAIDNLESYHYRKTGIQVNLSEQHVTDCISNTSCLGGNPAYAYLFVLLNGIHLETDYPYNGKQNKCQNTTEPRSNVSFISLGAVNGTDYELKTAVQNYGPLTTCLYVTPKWMFYKSGVWYHNECAKATNHCVIIVGYGTENGNDFWLIRNSWGSQWGLNGYIKIARNRHYNYCGLHSGLYII